MPGISSFSNEELADRLFAAVKEEADTVRTLKAALKQIVEFEELADKECLPDDIALECIAIAKHALKQIGESAYG